MSIVMKAGYAVVGIPNLANMQAPVKTWTKRYIVLSASCICVYPDLTSTGKPLHCVIILPETVADIATELSSTAGAEGSNEFRIFVRDPAQNHFIFVVSSSREQLAWIETLRRAISLSRFSLKAYITRLDKGSALFSKTRKYFILSKDTIYAYRDYDRVWDLEERFKFSISTVVRFSDDENIIRMKNQVGDKQSLDLCFEDKKADYLQWKEMVQKMGTFSSAKVGKMTEAIADCIKRRNVMCKFFGDKSANWKEYELILTTTTIVVLEPAANNTSDSSGVSIFDPARCVSIIDLTPDSFCDETNDSICTFVLSNRKIILHLREESTIEAKTWIKAIRECISVAAATKHDEVLSYAVHLIKEDVFYSIQIEEKGPLGFRLDAVEDGWVVVSESDPGSGVSMGSILSSVNHRNVLMKSSIDTIKLLLNWSPPLSLYFRKAPEIEGYLLERVHGALGSKVWKKRYFKMSSGHIERHDDKHCVASEVYSLAGAVVLRIPDEKYKRILCFQIVSGVDSIVVQAESSDELLSWLGHLCHGIAIANGGSYVRRVEQARASRLLNFKQRCALGQDEPNLHRRQSTMSLLGHRSTTDFNTMSSQLSLTSFAEDNPLNNSDLNTSAISDIDKYVLHGEEQWWWAMGGREEDFSEGAGLSPAEFSENDGAALTAAHDLMSQSEFFRRTNPAVSSPQVDKTSRRQFNNQDKFREEQEHIQSQLHRTNGDVNASRIIAHNALKTILRQEEIDFGQLEAALRLAEIWEVEGPEMDNAVALLDAHLQLNSSGAQLGTGAPKTKMTPYKMHPLRHADEIALAQRYVLSLLNLHPSNYPTHVSYEWGAQVIELVEDSIRKGSLLIPEAFANARADTWIDADNKVNGSTVLPIDSSVKEETVKCYLDSTSESVDSRVTKLLAADVCVQVYLNCIFVRELKTENNTKMLLEKNDIGILISRYDELSVCERDGHFSVILRVNLCASEDFNDTITVGGPVTAAAPGHQRHLSTASSTVSILSDMLEDKDDAALKSKGSRTTPGPAMTWIGQHSGELFKFVKPLMKSYLKNYKKLAELKKISSGSDAALAVEPLGDSFGEREESEQFGAIDNSPLFLKTSPEGRLDIEIECGNKRDRDVLYLTIFYLVSQGRVRGNMSALIPRNMSLRDRIQCLPWIAMKNAEPNDPFGNGSFDAAKGDNEKRILMETNWKLIEKAGQSVTTIQQLQNEVNELKNKYQLEKTKKDVEIAALQEKLEEREHLLYELRGELARLRQN